MKVPATVVVSLVVALSAGARAQDWARFRGPGGQGIGRGAPLPPVFAAENVLWRTAAGGGGHSSPVLWERGLYLTRSGGEPGRFEVVRFDARTGAEEWATGVAFEARPRHQLNSAASGSPAADRHGVYVVWTSADELFAGAFTHAGEPSWETRLGGYVALHGVATSPVVVDDRLVVASEHDGDDCALYAVDVASGEVAWRVSRERVEQCAVYATPVPIVDAGGTRSLLFAGTAHGLTALDPATGELRWELDLGFTARCIATPAITAGHVIVLGGSNDAGKDCAIVRLPVAADDAPAIVHRPRRRLPYVPGALAFGGRFHLVSDSGIASCLDAVTGEELWSERLDAKFFSSPVSDGRTLFVADREGLLHSLALGERFEQLGTFDLGAPVFATPAVVDGVMYVRTADELLCLGRPGAFGSGG